MEHRRRHRHHRHVHQAGQTECQQHFQVRVPDQPALLRLAAGVDAPGHQRRVQVDRMRHDCRTDNAHREGDAVRTVKLRYDRMEQRLAPVGWGNEQFYQIGEADDADETGDDQLDRAESAGLDAQQTPGDGEGDQQAGQQRQMKQHADADGGADRFGKIGGHRRDLTPQPHRDHHRPGKMRAAQRRQALAGDDAQPGG